MTDEDRANSIKVVVTNANDLADDLLAALQAPTSHAGASPLISGDTRDVLLDGHFDLVAVARHLREALRRDLAKLDDALGR